MKLEKSKIVAVKRYEAVKARGFFYRPAKRVKKIFGITVRKETKEHFTHYFNDIKYTVESLPGCFYVDEKTVMEKPELKISMVNGETYTKYFDSIEELDTWCKTNLKDANLMDF